MSSGCSEGLCHRLHSYKINAKTDAEEEAVTTSLLRSPPFVHLNLTVIHRVPIYNLLSTLLTLNKCPTLVMQDLHPYLLSTL